MDGGHNCEGSTYSIDSGSFGGDHVYARLCESSSGTKERGSGSNHREYTPHRRYYYQDDHPKRYHRTD